MTNAQIEAFKKITPGPWFDKTSETWNVSPHELLNDTRNKAALLLLPDLLAERERMIQAMKHALYRGHDFSDFCDGCTDLQKVLAEAEGGE